jgi:NADH dehydrogenase FAD-containing subunit
VNLLLVGGGHAMLPTLHDAGRWVSRGVRVTLLDPSPVLYYSGMVPEYLGGVYDRDAVCIDLRRLCERTGVHFVESAAEHLDPERRLITTAAGDSFSYDVAAIDVGARNPGLIPQAVQTKPLYHIEALEEAIRRTLHTSGRRLRLVIAGGGAAGVEIALNVTGRFAQHGARAALDLTVVEGTDRLLSSFPRGMSKYVTQMLEMRGARIERGTQVRTARSGAAVLSDQRTIDADLVLWSTGSIGPALFDDAGLICDPQGFARVTPTLQCVGFHRLFAAGDCATVVGHEALRKVGVHAVKQGPVLRANIDRTLSALRAGQPPHTWSLDTFEPYWAAPLILSTGASEGLWTAGSIWLHGRPFLRLKHYVDRRWIRRYNATWDTANTLQLADAAAANT